MLDKQRCLQNIKVVVMQVIDTICVNLWQRFENTQDFLEGFQQYSVESSEAEGLSAQPPAAEQFSVH